MSRATVVFSVAVVALCLSAPFDSRGLAQETTAVIAGRILDSASGKPVVDAAVFASTPEGTRLQHTGPTGEFAITFSNPVQIRLWADKPGYLRTYAAQAGSTDSSSQAATIDISAGARVFRVLMLSAAAAIGGTVSDGTEPVAAATVVVLRREYRGAGFAWAKVPLKSAQSDDRGVYRVSGLAPGNYMVAVVREGPTVGAVPRPTFAPATRASNRATVFTLAAGVEETAADVRLSTNDAVASLVGRVLNGQAGVGRVTVRLRRMIVGNETPTDFDEITEVTDDAGAFRFSDVPVGSYTLRVVQFPSSDPPLLTLGGNFHGYVFGAGRDDRNAPAAGAPVPALPTASTLYAERDVVVDPKISDAIVLSLQPVPFISGRVVFQDGIPPAPDDLVKIPMLIRPADGSVWGGIPQARIERDGTFRSPGLPPGDYVVVPLVSRAGLPQAWATIALTSGGTDYLGGAISVRANNVTDVLVTLSTKSAEVSGIVGWPTATAKALRTRVIVFPKLERQKTFYYAFPTPKRVIQANVSMSGAFRVVLPPGEYFAAAITGELSEFWMTPEYLARLLPAATAIRVGVGEKVSVALQARPGARGSHP